MDTALTLPTREVVSRRGHVHPLRRLFAYAHRNRRDVWLASLFSVLNKFFDVLPEFSSGSQWAVRSADVTHVLEAGRIIAGGGAYAALWKLQTGEAPHLDRSDASPRDVIFIDGS